MGIMRILDATGDTTVTWSVQDAATLERAEAVFEQMRQQRHMAFAVPQGGLAEDAERVQSFDPAADEIIWVRAIQGGEMRVPDDLEVVERFADGRELLRFVSGALAGRTVMAFPESAFHDACLSPFERAQRLLLSLLTPEQETTWRGSRTFRVTTRYGIVELGRLFDIGFWPTDGGEFRLCVIPSGQRLPAPDVWTNLLLALQHDPRYFFTIANWRRPGGRWFHAPVPGFE